ncbi:protein kinase domain-containing protein [Hamiltosporidium magnivora]|uniref:Protein kinase domain-containing protein n=1 Tax=Hamiltosporidium magnivora TaxID=148818 RepID=A0A4Q9LMZ0_9MICR|nr:protein kinase domain-containing protein [Hamiltosporidium magnivora]
MKFICKLLIYKLLVCEIDCSNINFTESITFIKNGVSEAFLPIKHLGFGVQGNVYLVQKNGTDELYALKVQVKRNRRVLITLNLFKNYLKHENIVKFYNFKEDSTNDYLLFEYLPITLEKYLASKKKTFLNFTFIMKQILDAFNFLKTRNIVLGDFKFDNVMLENNLKVKLIDFGIAHFENYQYIWFTDNDIRTGKNNRGRFSYIAPEIRNGRIYKSNSDIYSFAFVFRKFLTKSESNFINNNDGINDLLNICLENDPNVRISADVALLHPLFNVLYSFVICFADLENFEISNEETKIKIMNKVLFYEHPEYSFALQCCCSEDKKEFTKFKYSIDQINMQCTNYSMKIANERTKELAEFRAIIGDAVLPIQHLTFSYYNELKNIFNAIKPENYKTKQTQKKRQNPDTKTPKEPQKRRLNH